jgi:hypothetical protein
MSTTVGSGRSRKYKNAVRDMRRVEQIRERQRLEELALRRNLTMADLFTCKECGSHDLRVEREYTLIQTYCHYLPCTCGETDEAAAAYESEQQTFVEEWGYLNEGHRVDWDEGDRQSTDGDREDGPPTIHCSVCFEQATEQDWQLEEPDPRAEEEIEDEEWFVCCDGCNREIEFGWSLPDGRIWPAELGDFHPGCCCPEPRYRESWKEKGWLRPTGRR